MSEAGGVDLLAHLRRQSEACADLGSPIYSALLAFAADDYAAQGPVADVLDGWTADPGPAALALRLMGTVHRLVLTGCAPDLARFYASAVGHAVEPFDPGEAWVALREVLRSRPDEIRAGLAQPPQTNEIGRCALLIGGLLVARCRARLPVALVEVGASAGLNLRPDLVRLDLPGGGIGPGDSPVVLRDPWQGAAPGADVGLRIASRLGSDLDPIDVQTEAGRIRLLSYLWPDQPERLARLRGAFELADRVPVQVQAESAARTVAKLKPEPGVLTLVWHSVMQQYLPAQERLGLEAAFDTLGRSASAGAPVARLAFEPTPRDKPGGIEFRLHLRMWPDGANEHLATAHPHGNTVVWHRR